MSVSPEDTTIKRLLEILRSRRKVELDDKSGGFTLVELAVTMPIVVIVIVTLFAFMVILYTQNLRSIGRLQAVSDVNDGLDAIRTDVELSEYVSKYIDSNNTDSYGPPGGGTWQSTGDWADSTNTNVIPPFSQVILAAPSTTAGPQDPSRDYVRINVNGCGASVLLSNPVYIYNIIYFVYQNVLYKRIVTDPTPPSLCGNPIQKPTCPVYTSASGCIKDTIVMTNVSQFLVRYQIPAVELFPNIHCPAPRSEHSNYEDENSLCTTADGPDGARVLTILTSVTRNIGGNPYSYGHRISSAPLGGATN